MTPADELSVNIRLGRIEVTLGRIEERAVAHEEVHRLEERRRVEAVGALAKDLDSLNDVRVRFIPRQEHDVEMAALMGRLEALESFRAKAAGVGSVLVLFSGLVGALVLRVLGG